MVTAGTILSFFLFDLKIKYGHALWLTASGYFVGIYIAKCHKNAPLLFSSVIVFGSAICMLTFHYAFHFDSANFPLILMLACGIMLILMEIDLPRQISGPAGWFSGILLEIYLLHPYLLVTPTKMVVLNIALSMGIVIGVSIMLSYIAQTISNKLFPKSTVKIKPTQTQ